ncbi:porin [Paraburkholderia sp. EG286B]|uniref:porin n=1 Tax=Paraburkholderia sp. EG286B TaxID=3237011 RepID=UPI0034D2C0D9
MRPRHLIRQSLLSITFIAISVCVFPRESSAQNSVVLYGVVDSGILWQNRTTAGGQSSLETLDGGLNPSIYGFMGKEDLGGRTAATFVLEGGFSSINGSLASSNGGIFGRKAYVGLTNPDFGSLTAGLQYSPFFLAVMGSDARLGADFASSLVPYLNNFLITGMFDENSLVYTSPNFHGLAASVELALGNQPGNFNAGKRTSASVTYSNSGLYANAAYYASRSDTTGTLEAEGRTAGIGYTYQSITVKAAVTNYRRPQTTYSNVYVYGLGFNWTIQPALTWDAGVYVSRNESDSGGHSTMAGTGLMYSLSKRSTIYTQVGFTRNSGGLGTGLATNTSTSLQGLDDGNTVGIVVGLRQQF